MIKVKITCEPKRRGKFIWAVEGTLLCGSSRQPLLDACRALSVAGTPDSEYAGLYRDGRLSMTCQVGYGRKKTVDEANGLWLAPWRPHSRFAKKG